MSPLFLFYFNVSSFALVVANFLICFCFISLYTPQIAHLATQTNLQATTQLKKYEVHCISLFITADPIF